MSDSEAKLTVVVQGKARNIQTKQIQVYNTPPWRCEPLVVAKVPRCFHNNSGKK